MVDDEEDFFGAAIDEGDAFDDQTYSPYEVDPQGYQGYQGDPTGRGASGYPSNAGYGSRRRRRIPFPRFDSARAFDPIEAAQMTQDAEDRRAFDEQGAIFDQETADINATTRNKLRAARAFRIPKPASLNPLDDPIFKEINAERSRQMKTEADYRKVVADFDKTEGRALKPVKDPNNTQKLDEYQWKIDQMRNELAAHGQVGGLGQGKVTQEMIGIAAQRKQLLERRQRLAAEAERVARARMDFDQQVYLPTRAQLLSRSRDYSTEADMPQDVTPQAPDYLAAPEQVQRRLPAPDFSTEEDTPPAMPDFTAPPPPPSAPTPETPAPLTGPTPAELIRMHKRRQDLKATLAESGDNLDPKLQTGMRDRIEKLNQQFTEGFANQSPAFQKRISDITRDPTLLESVGGGLVNVAKGAGQAAVDTGEFAARNALRLVGQGTDTPTQETVKDFAQAMRDETEGWKNWMPEEVRKKVDESFVSGDVAQGAGSSILFMAPTGIVGGLGRAVGLGNKALGRLITASVATTGAATEANSFRREAEQKLRPQLDSGEITQNEFDTSLGMAEIFGVPLGMTEAVPLSSFSRRIAGTPAGKSFLRTMLGIAGRDGASGVRKWMAGPGRKMLVDVVGESGEELVQEFGQQVGENLYASQTFDPGREVVDSGALRGGAAGGISGAIFSTLSQLAGGRRRASRYRDLTEQRSIRPDTPSNPDATGQTEPVPPPPSPETPGAAIAPETALPPVDAEWEKEIRSRIDETGMTDEDYTKKAEEARQPIPLPPETVPGTETLELKPLPEGITANPPWGPDMPAQQPTYNIPDPTSPRGIITRDKQWLDDNGYDTTKLPAQPASPNEIPPGNEGVETPRAVGEPVAGEVGAEGRPSDGGPDVPVPAERVGDEVRGGPYGETPVVLPEPAVVEPVTPSGEEPKAKVPEQPVVEAASPDEEAAPVTEVPAKPEAAPAPPGSEPVSSGPASETPGSQATENLPTTPIEGKPEPVSRRQIADQRRLVRKMEKNVAGFVERDPEKAKPFVNKLAKEQEKLAQMEANKGTGSTPRVGMAPNGEPDLLTDIAENIGTIATRPREGSIKGGEHDDIAPALQNGAARMLRSETGMAPDQALAIINELGYKFDSISDFAVAIGKAADNRKKLTASLGVEKYQRGIEGAFTERKGRAPGTKTAPPMKIERAGVGATFKIRGEKFSVVDVEESVDGTFQYVVKDGHKFKVPEGTDIFADAGTIKKGPKQSTEFLPPESKNEDVHVPPVGGELFDTGSTFNLAGEKPSETPAQPDIPSSGAAQSEMFQVEQIVQHNDPVKSADAAQELYGEPGTAADRLERQLAIFDSDPANRKNFDKDQRARLKEVLSLLRQRASKPSLTAERAPVASARPVAAVESDVAAWSKSNKGAPEVVVVNDPNWKDENGRGVKGQYLNGKLTVNAAYAPDAAAVHEIANHEWAHDTFASRPGQIAVVTFSQREIPTEQLSRLSQKYPQASRLDLIEEWLAENAEKQPGVFKRIVERLREWLAKRGHVTLTNEEVGRAVLRSLRANKEATISGRPARFSVTDEPVTETKESKLTENLRAKVNAPVDPIEYAIRHQPERIDEATAIIAKNGPQLAERRMQEDKTISPDTAVAIGAVLLKGRMEALASAKPEDVAKITGEINRITAAMQPAQTGAGQQISMINALYRHLGAYTAVVEYGKGLAKEHGKRLGDKFPHDAAAQVNKGVREAGNQAATEIEAAVNLGEGDKPKGAWGTKYQSVIALLRNAAKQRGVKWADVFTALPESQDARRQELFDRVKANPKLQNLTDPQKQKLATLLDEAWTDLRNQIVRREFARLVPLPNVAKPDVKKVHSVVNDLVRRSNLGLLDNAAFLDALAEKYGMESLSGPTAKRLADLAKKAEAMPEGFQRNRATIDVLTELKKVKGISKMDVASAIYYAHILSGGTTQAANAMSTSLNTAANLSILAIQNPGQALDILRGAKEGLGYGWLNAVNTLKTGYSDRALITKSEATMDSGVGAKTQPLSVTETLAKGAPETIGGKGLKGWATVFRYVGRAMQAVDTVFFESAQGAFQHMAAAQIAATAEDGKLSRPEKNKMVRELLAMNPDVFAAAERQAKSEGLKGLDYKLRVAEIVRQRRAKNIGPEDVEGGHQFSLASTFNQKPRGLLGIIAEGIANMSQQIPPLRLFVPFTNIVANVANESLNYSPMGVKRSVMGYYKESAPVGWEREQLIFKGAVGTLTMVAMAAYLLNNGDDKKEPLITGRGPKEKNKRDQLRATGWMPYSVKVGNRYIPYLLTPFSIPAAIFGNLADSFYYDKASSKEIGKWAGTALMGIPGSITSQSFLSGLGQLADIMRGQEEKPWQKLAQSTVGAAVPNAIQQIDKAFSPTLRDTSGVKGLVAGRVPFARQTLPAQVDVRGRDVIPAPQSTRFIGRGESDDELAKVLADKQAHITGFTRPKLGPPNKKRQATDEEFRAYQRDAGAAIDRRLQSVLPRLRGSTPAEAQKLVATISQQEHIAARINLERRAFNPFAGR